MMNSHMPYYAPFTQGNTGIMLWLNLDPDYRTESGGVVSEWKNFMKTSEIFGNTNSARHPADNGTHITFDGTDFLKCNVDRDLNTAGTGWTIYMRTTEVDWSANSALAGDDNTNNMFIKNVGDQFSIKCYDGSSASTKVLTFDDPTDLVDGQYYNLAVTCTTAGLATAYIDGVAQADTANFTNTFNMIFSEIGGKNGTGWMLDGNIQEVLVWPAPLTALQIADVNTYLNNKF